MNMKKSKIIQDLGIQILESIKEKQDILERELHPVNTQFKPDEDVAYIKGYRNSLRDIYSALYSSLNLKYNQALSEENESNS